MILYAFLKHIKEKRLLMNYYDLIKKDPNILDDLGDYLIAYLQKKDTYFGLFVDKNISKHDISYSVRILNFIIGERIPDIICEISFYFDNTTMTGGNINCINMAHSYFKYYNRKKVIDELF